MRWVTYRNADGVDKVGLLVDGEIHGVAGDSTMLGLLERGPEAMRELGEQTLDPGDVVSFPTGFSGAHQVRNMSDGPARVAIVSAQTDVCIVEYPEERQVEIWAGDVHYTLDHSAT